MIRLTRYALVVLVAVFGLAAVACSSGGAAAGGGGGSGAVSVTLTDMKFDPGTITVKSGETVSLELKNSGAVVHDFSIEAASVHEVVEPGKSATVQFTAPAAGTYKIVCTQPGHEAAGMVGELVVQ